MSRSEFEGRLIVFLLFACFVGALFALAWLGGYLT